MRLPTLILVSVLATPRGASAQEPPADAEASFSLGINALELTLLTIASAVKGSPFTPIPIEGNLLLSEEWGLATTVMYRHEEDAALEVDEISFAVGPRYAFSGTGLEGWYASLKLGIGPPGSSPRASAE